MSKQNDIAEQIRKYLNGELDGPAMHRLEKEAQNDPFLMDALEGYAQAGAGQDAHLAELYSRLDERTSLPVRRLLPWKILSIAASVLVMIAVGAMFITRKSSPTNEAALAHEQSIISADKQGEVIQSPPALQRPAGVPVIAEKAEQLKGNDYAALRRPKRTRQAKVPIVVSADADFSNSMFNAVSDAKSDSLQETIALGFFSQGAKDTMAIAAATPPNNPVSQALAGRVAGIQVNSLSPTGSVKVISGTVTDGVSPLPGAAVSIEGKNTGTVTDVNGRFKLFSVPDKSTLDINYVGYKKQRVKINGQDSLSIAMQPAEGALSEVVVVGYGSATKNNVAKASNKGIVNRNVEHTEISPDGTAGEVKLTFILSADNAVSNIKIVQKLTPATDKKATDLASVVPQWLKNTSGKTQLVTLKVKFVKE